MSERIVVLNAGSSSIKFALYDTESLHAVLFRGQVEKIGVSPRLRVSDAGGAVVEKQEWPAEGFDHHAATTAILQTAIRLLGGASVAGVGHRIAHGGTEYAAPIRITADVMADLKR